MMQMAMSVLSPCSTANRLPAQIHVRRVVSLKTPKKFETENWNNRESAGVRGLNFQKFSDFESLPTRAVLPVCIGLLSPALSSSEEERESYCARHSHLRILSSYLM